MRIEDYSFGKIWVDVRPYAADLILYPGRVEENWYLLLRAAYYETGDYPGVLGVLADLVNGFDLFLDGLDGIMRLDELGQRLEDQWPGSEVTGAGMVRLLARRSGCFKDTRGA